MNVHCYGLLFQTAESNTAKLQRATQRHEGHVMTMFCHSSLRLDGCGKREEGEKEVH